MDTSRDQISRTNDAGKQQRLSAIRNISIVPIVTLLWIIAVDPGIFGGASLSKWTTFAARLFVHR